MDSLPARQALWEELGASDYLHWFCNELGYDTSIVDPTLTVTPFTQKTLERYVLRNGAVPPVEEIESEDSEVFDPEAAKPTDNPFPEELKDETPVSDSPEAPDEEAAVEEETPMPVGRKCSVCGETGHNKRNCPTLAAEEATEAGVSESNGGKDATTE